MMMMMMMSRGCAIVLLCLVGVWPRARGGVAAVTSAEDPVGCAPALEYLVKHNVAAHEHLAQLPGQGSEVCGGGVCCVPAVTEVVREAGRASLSQVVRATADTLHAALTSHRDTFYGVVESALAHSEHRALNVFQATYPRLAPAARQVLHDLYASLRVGLTDPDDRALENALGNFWDDLFPPVYHSVLHARLAPFSRRYTECLRDAQRVVQPWGIIPTLVGEPLLRGLHSARLLLHSLDVGAQVVDTARNFPIPSECADAAARLQFCGACHGALAPPCTGMCLNVARGCLAPLAEVDGAWADLAGAVGRVQESLQAVRLAHLLHQLPDKLSEAVMVALERGPQLQKKVRRDCSTPTHEESGHTAHHLPPAPVEPAAPAGEERGSGRVLESAGAAVRAVEAAREWWAGLPEAHCNSLATQDTHCWNGIRIAPYTKTTAGVGVSAQKYNPEVRIDHPDTSVYTLADKLRGVRRLVLTQLTWLPRSDARRRHNEGQADGSGSGVEGRMEPRSRSSSSSSPSDDDDENYNTYYDDYYNNDAGSGSGEGGSEPNIIAEETNKTSSVTASSAQLGSSVLVLLFTLATALYAFNG
ncbi:glypican-5 isoform X2 [Procambarus clarkii]|uniref:glypican-5 isoform X2 n=1 Tax=Procambarus clarkii TaxID=6728 RepID=UPI001E671BCA|nr:glypican-5-like isoform X2 [Procambarus clarkii]